MMERRYDDYVISDDKTMLSLERIKNLLSNSYWAKNRPAEVILKSIENSVCYGIYYEKYQVGFARVVTDWVTVYYLCDVFIDEKYRGKGLGKKLIEIIVGEFEGMMGLLGTLDAHGLYEQYGFKKNSERLMNRRPNNGSN